MKYLILLFTVPLLSISQVDVPEEYWINDSNFEESISKKSAFGDEDNKPVLVEFWAEFNKANCFSDWEKVENVTYYRVNIAEAPEAKKKYRVRMAPTLIIFKNGIKEKVFKAGLDLVLPADLKEIQDSIDEINTANKF
jgi:thiol-disulfide isomerase/thioredoxin